MHRRSPALGADPELDELAEGSVDVVLVDLAEPPGPARLVWLGDVGVAATVARASGVTPDEVVDEAVGGIVTGRSSQPREVADAVVMLASDRAANVTGADLRVDGGFVPTS